MARIKFNHIEHTKSDPNGLLFYWREREWDKFVKTAGGEKTQIITRAEVAYFQTLKRRRCGTAMNIINHVAIT